MTDPVERCRASIAHHSKSFALASKLLPRRCRDDAAIVYAWCRRADDAIDLAEGQAQHTSLSRLRDELEAVYSEAPLEDDVLGAFREVTRRRLIPRAYPEELLLGMEMDARGHDYESMDDLMLYCYRVASTVGLMMCHVMGVDEERALRHAAHLGLAMQLTNICRDVHEDWRRSRLYLPDDLLARHGAPRLRNQLGARFPESGRLACRGALKETLAVAQRFYASGDAGLEYLSPRCALAVDVARRVYSDIGRVLAAQGHDVLAPRAVVSTSRKLAACGKASLAMVGRRHRHSSRRPSGAASLPPVSYGPEFITP